VWRILAGGNVEVYQKGVKIENITGTWRKSGKTVKINFGTSKNTTILELQSDGSLEVTALIGEDGEKSKTSLKISWKKEE